MVRCIRARELIAACLFIVTHFLMIDAAPHIDIVYPPNYARPHRSESKMGSYRKGAVAANGPGCAKIGSAMLKKGGSAVDAAIAALLCEGVVSLHSMGIGGGFLMTIWDAPNKTAHFLNARETAPAAADSAMFGTNASLAFRGGLSIAIPGELAGYWAAHQRFGNLKWSELFEPTIKICKEGSPVNEYIAHSLASVEDEIMAEPTLAEILINDKTGKLVKEGDRIKRPALAATLEKIANAKNVSIFYGGEIGQNLIREIQAMGGIMTIQDLENYRVKWKKPTVRHLHDLTLFSAPPPGSGVILGFMMDILQGLLPTPEPNVFWSRLVESFKWAYARRAEFGDPEFTEIDDIRGNLTNKQYVEYIRKLIRDDLTNEDPKYYSAKSQAVDDAGTANICVLAPDGSAVTVTSTINQYLGAMKRSPSTGIILNDEMDDFSSEYFANGFMLPPSPSNFIAPGKRPMSSMSPSIIIDKDEKVRMLVGSAGGSKITTAIATVMALHLYADFNIKEAVDSPRIHHQLLPMTVDYEKDFDPHILSHLVGIGHFVSTHPRMGSTITAITQKDGVIQANSDYRRQGSVAGVDPF